MKFSTLLQRLGQSICLLSLIASPTVFAAKANPNLKKSYLIQTFEQGTLAVEFRYINNKLDHLQFTNKGKSALKINVLEHFYVLAPGGSTRIPAPNVRILKVGVLPYIEGVSENNNGFATILMKETLYQLPGHDQK